MRIEKDMGLIQFSEITTDAKPVQVLRVGTWNHPKYGKVEFTPDTLRQIVRNFNEGVRGSRIPINYEHGMSAAHGTKAAGWFTALELRNDDTELWAIPEWTPEAKQSIKDGEWRYFSSEVLPEWTNPESGRTFSNVLRGGAVTNDPFIRDMEPIAASEAAANQTTKGQGKMKLEEIGAVLLSEHGVNLSDLQARAAKVEGLEKQVVELSEKAGKVEGLEKKVVELSAQVVKTEAEKGALQFSALVEKGMAEGKLTKAFADSHFKAMHEKMGYEFCEKFLSEMPVVVKTAPKGDSTGVAPKEGDLMDKASKLAKEKGMAFGEALAQVTRENPEAAKAHIALAESAAAAE